MKKLLLSMLAACAVVGASAAVTDLKAVWNVSQECAPQDTMLWNAPVAVDAAGNLYGTGAFNKEFAPAGTTLTPVGTSAFIGKWDVNGGVKWAVAITGAASITAVDVDAAGNVYVAGVYADEITFGTTSGDPIVKEGQLVAGEPTMEKNSSFIAKYDANGVVKAVTTFVPDGLPELVATGMYYPMDGDVYFKINHLQAAADAVYASAVFTGYTKNGEAEFKGSYNDPWFGEFFVDISSAAVLKLNADLAGCQNVLNCSTDGALATLDAQYSASSVTFDAAGDYVNAVFAGNGPLVVSSAKSVEKAETPSTEYDYICVSLSADGETIALQNRIAAPAAGVKTLNVPSKIYSNAQGGVCFVGYESYAENAGTDDQRVGEQVFTIDNVFGNPVKTEHEFVDGNVNYSEISAAAVTPDGTILVSALGYYTDKVEGEGGHSMGDFAGTSQVYALMGGQGFPVPNGGLSYGIATAGSYAALSQIGWGGVSYTLFNDPTGVEDIVVDSNASAEYFNLQGVRVANPENGLYIRRQGTKAAKVLVK